MQDTKQRRHGLTRHSGLIAGQPFAVGTGFKALSFRHAQYAGMMDPLIMVDHFTMRAPTFGPHPHAGLSAVSLLFEDSVGAFNNQDSLGNDLDLMPGDLYWLKAGCGAVHDEKPKPGGRTHALQVFVNLPAAMKYDAPDALHVKARDMPVLEGAGWRTRIALGQSQGTNGASAPALPMTILDIHLDKDGRFEHEIPAGRAAFILSVSGSVRLDRGDAPLAMEAGYSTSIHAGDAGAALRMHGVSKSHLVLLQAAPIREPFVQRGPFAMSTDAEIEAMIAAHQNGALGALD